MHFLSLEVITVTNIIYIYIYIYKDLLHKNQWKLHIGLQIVPITNLPLLSH